MGAWGPGALDGGLWRGGSWPRCSLPRGPSSQCPARARQPLRGPFPLLQFRRNPPADAFSECLFSQLTCSGGGQGVTHSCPWLLMRQESRGPDFWGVGPARCGVGPPQSKAGKGGGSTGPGSALWLRLPRAPDGGGLLGPGGSSSDSSSQAPLLPRHLSSLVPSAGVPGDTGAGRTSPREQKTCWRLRQLSLHSFPRGLRVSLDGRLPRREQ